MQNDCDRPASYASEKIMMLWLVARGADSAGRFIDVFCSMIGWLWMHVDDGDWFCVELIGRRCSTIGEQQLRAQASGSEN